MGFFYAFMGLPPVAQYGVIGALLLVHLAVGLAALLERNDR